MANEPVYIDLFAGCGGISLGLHKSGWKGLFAIEKSAMAFETLKFNLIDKTNHFLWTDWLPKRNYDINYFIKRYESNLQELAGNVDMVVGGPPCQGFSMAGRRNESDKRNSLIKSYIKFIKLVQPKILLFENVKGFTIGFKRKNNRSEPYSEYVISELKKLGYDVEGRIINFSDFGVPQRRQRFIIIGSKITTAKEIFDKLFEESKKILEKKGLSQKASVKDAISDLVKAKGTINSKDTNGFKAGIYATSQTQYQRVMRQDCLLKYPDSHRFANHQPKTIEKFKVILRDSQKNKSVEEHIRKKFNMKKHSIIPLDGKSSAPTLTTLPDDYIHYKEPRILTVREYARIQSFPDWFEFKNKYTSGGKLRKSEVPRYTQIGNAIPPLFGEIIGEIILRTLSEEKIPQITSIANKELLIEVKI